MYKKKRLIKKSEQERGGLEIIYLEAPKEGQALRDFNDFLAESLARYDRLMREEEKEYLIARQKARMLYRTYGVLWHNPK